MEVSNVHTEVICSSNTDSDVLCLHDSGCSVGSGTEIPNNVLMCPQLWAFALSWLEAYTHYCNQCRQVNVNVGPVVLTARCVHKCVLVFSNVAFLYIISSWRWFVVCGT